METKEMELQNLEDSLFEKDDSAHVNADKMSRPSLTYWSDAWRRFKGNKVVGSSSDPDHEARCISYYSGYCSYRMDRHGQTFQRSGILIKRIRVCYGQQDYGSRKPSHYYEAPSS